MIKEDPNYYGHEPPAVPHPNIIRKWTGIRDLDDLFVQFGKEENGKKIIDLESAGYDKLLGGGKITNSYSVKIKQFTALAEEKVKTAGGEILQSPSKEKTVEA